MHQIRFPSSVRSFVRPFVFDTVDESQRRRHSSMAAIVVDFGVRSTQCASLSVRPSLRWSLTLWA